jgi:hypothetical protein
MRKSKIMTSKVLIVFDENRNPILRVEESISQDPRDVMFEFFREQLKTVSNTLTVTFIPPSPSLGSTNSKVYEISPISDELAYFEERIMKMVSFQPNSPNRQIITDFFESLKPVCLNGHNQDAIDKFNLWNTGPLNEE